MKVYLYIRQGGQQGLLRRQTLVLDSLGIFYIIYFAESEILNIFEGMIEMTTNK